MSAHLPKLFLKVSPTYSQEVAGNPVIAPHLYKFHGILNGIDPDMGTHLTTSSFLYLHTSENVVEGKKAAKEALQQSHGLERADLPLVGIITRTHQKGIHLIKHAIWRALDSGRQVVLLVSAPDPCIQNDFVNLASQLHSTHNDRARLVLTYDEPLSHLVYILILIELLSTGGNFDPFTYERVDSGYVLSLTGQTGNYNS